MEVQKNTNAIVQGVFNKYAEKCHSLLNNYDKDDMNCLKYVDSFILLLFTSQNI